MAEIGLTKPQTNWQEKIAEREALLEEVTGTLIELETQLTERLAETNAFEFRLRSKLRPWIRRLEVLEGEIQQYLRQLRRNDHEFNDDDWYAWSRNDQWVGAGGDYRYRETAVPEQPPDLDADKGHQLKRMYRELARRFHPDMGVDEADRAYRTQIMMAINAAYAAGDLEKLQELALEPDAASLVAYARTDEQLAEALLHEIERCRRRIKEIRLELETLANHESSKLMRRVKRTAAEGRDLLSEIVAELKENIAHKMVERDVLKSEVENLQKADFGLQGDAFADAILDISLDQAYDESPESEFAEWIVRRGHRSYDDDDILDDSD